MMQVPSVVQPKSNPAMFTPANRVRPEVEVADADAELDAWVEDVAGFEDVVADVAGFEDVVARVVLAGRHCE